MEEFRLNTLTSWNHQPYIRHNLIIIYQMKVIRILALLQHIFLLLYTSLFRKDL